MYTSIYQPIHQSIYPLSIYVSINLSDQFIIYLFLPEKNLDDMDLDELDELEDEEEEKILLQMR